MLHETTTSAIIGCFHKVNRAVPSGLFESVYQRALVIELREQGMWVETEVPIELLYRRHAVGDYRLDVVVDGAVLVECKRAPKLAPSHSQQLVHYLRATGLTVGLLLNFGTPPTLKRSVNTKHHDTPDFQFRRKR